MAVNTVPYLGLTVRGEDVAVILNYRTSSLPHMMLINEFTLLTIGRAVRGLMQVRATYLKRGGSLRRARSMTALP